MIDYKTNSMSKVVTTGQAGEPLTLTTVGSLCPLVANFETLQPREKGGKQDTNGAGNEGRWRGRSNRVSALIEVTSRPSRYPQQPDMMS